MQVRFTVPDVVTCLFHCKYDPICREFQSVDSTLSYLPRSLKIQSRFLRSYVRNCQSSPYNFQFASLVSKTKTNMDKEIVNKRRKKNYLQRIQCKQDKVKVVNLCGSISTWFSSLQGKAVVQRYSSK